MTKLRMDNLADATNPLIFKSVPPVRGGRGAPPGRKFGGLNAIDALTFLEVAMDNPGQAIVIRDYLLPDDRYTRVTLSQRVSYNRAALIRFLTDHADGARVTLASRVVPEEVDGQPMIRGRLFLTIHGGAR